jgi:hypothetical protein
MPRAKLVEDRFNACQWVNPRLGSQTDGAGQHRVAHRGIRDRVVSISAT